MTYIPSITPEQNALSAINLLGPHKDTSTMLKLKLISAGVKNGTWPAADLYIDCRGIPNPVYAHDLAGGTGDDPHIQAWVSANAGPELHLFTELIIRSVKQIPTRRNHDADPFAKPYVVCFLCAHGIHRSRSMKHLIGKCLSGLTSISGKAFTIEIA